MEEAKARILVVEDEQPTARLLRWQLEECGYAVQVAECGSRALSYADAYRPDLVILDVQLPDIHGYQVCEELRRRYHPWVVPILMLAGTAQPIDQLRGFAHGADAYMTKPFEFPELLRTVSLLLGNMALT
ncbi:MAG: response regulator [Candidatus Omnitrophica bacterium]|nr:response regulator [Candidatus Omnitrophota bacterium]